MPKISNMTYKDIVQMLKNNWFVFYKQWKWSHELRVRDKDKKVVPVANHWSKIMRIWTVKAILREIWIWVDEIW